MKMSKEAREARNAYFREWRKNNPEKVKQHLQRYWERKAEQMQDNGKAATQ